jgi:hypothetical protein
MSSIANSGILIGGIVSISWIINIIRIALWILGLTWYSVFVHLARYPSLIAMRAGVTLHSYRYSWAERANKAVIPNASPGRPVDTTARPFIEPTRKMRSWNCRA